MESRFNTIKNLNLQFLVGLGYMLRDLKKGIDLASKAEKLSQAQYDDLAKQLHDVRSAIFTLSSPEVPVVRESLLAKNYAEQLEALKGKISKPESVPTLPPAGLLARHSLVKSERTPKSPPMAPADPGDKGSRIKRMSVAPNIIPPSNTRFGTL